MVLLLGKDRCKGLGERIKVGAWGPNPSKREKELKDLGAAQPEGVFAEQKRTEGTEVELEPDSQRGGSVRPIYLPGLGVGLTEPRSGPKMALTLTTFTSASCHRGIEGASHSTWMQRHTYKYTYTRMHVLTACQVRYPRPQFGRGRGGGGRYWNRDQRSPEARHGPEQPPPPPLLAAPVYEEA